MIGWRPSRMSPWVWLDSRYTHWLAPLLFCMLWPPRPFSSFLATPNLCLFHLEVCTLIKNEKIPLRVAPVARLSQSSKRVMIIDPPGTKIPFRHDNRKPLRFFSQPSVQPFSSIPIHERSVEKNIFDPNWIILFVCTKQTQSHLYRMCVLAQTGKSVNAEFYLQP